MQKVLQTSSSLISMEVASAVAILVHYLLATSCNILQHLATSCNILQLDMTPGFDVTHVTYRDILCCHDTVLAGNSRSPGRCSSGNHHPYYQNQLQKEIIDHMPHRVATINHICQKAKQSFNACCNLNTAIFRRSAVR